MTIRCPLAEPGKKGIVNGVEYEAVDRSLLDQKIDNGEDLSKVCTSPVTDMGWMLFDRAENFDQEISSWDVSNVTDMGRMFAGATSFNSDLSNWDVSSVTDMSWMFGRDWVLGGGVTEEGATSFNGDISSWNVSSVIDMTGMFSDARNFNQDLSG